MLIDDGCCKPRCHKDCADRASAGMITRLALSLPANHASAWQRCKFVKLLQLISMIVDSRHMSHLRVAVRKLAVD